MNEEQEIIKYVRMLCASFGPRTVPDSALFQARSFHSAGQLSDCIGEIKRILGLRLTIRVGYLRERPSPQGLFRLIRENLQQLGYAVPDSLFEQLGVERCVENTSAFVIRPPNTPLYGTSEFDKFKILMFVYKHVLNLPFEAFAYCITHELAHIVLEGVRNPLRDIERAVDLATMVLGFSDVIEKGRRLGELTLGYLDDKQFRIACDEIKRCRRIIYL